MVTLLMMLTNDYMGNEFFIALVVDVAIVVGLLMWLL